MSQANESDYAVDQVLTGPAAAGRGPATGLRAAVRLPASRTFRSLGNRNYRLFAAGQVIANSTTQLATAADMRGRVMGLYLLVFLGGAPLGSPLAGWIAEQFGPRMSMVFGGLISVAATVAAGIMLARRRGTPVRRYLRPAELARMVA